MGKGAHGHSHSHGGSDNTLTTALAPGTGIPHQRSNQNLDGRPSLFRTRMARMHEEHNYGVGDGGLRAAVFGFCDGLVSNCCLVIGMYGAVSSGDSSVGTLLMTALAGLIAGAASMASGEWISMLAQEEAEQRELNTERRHITDDFDLEAEELTEFLEKNGVSSSVAQLVTRDICTGPNPVDAMLNMHARLELGIDPDEVGGGAPIKAALFSFGTFAVGAFIPLLPWLLVYTLHDAKGLTFLNATVGFYLTVILSSFSLFLAGACLSRYTSRGWLYSGSRQLGVGILAGALSFAVGAAFGTTIE